MKKTITKQGFIRFYTYLTVFTAGAVILMLEILGSRIMAPYYGNTIYVWSSLISVAMLALAAGYFLGGWIADRRPSYSVLYGVIFLASLFMLLIPVMSSQVLMAANKLGPRYGAFFGAAVLFTAPLLLLGVVSPFAVRLSLKNIEGAGMAAGSLYSVSTIGCFCGAILAGFYLIPVMGISKMIIMMAVFPALLSLAWFLINGKRKAAVALLIPFVFISAVNAANEMYLKKRDISVIFDTESMYSRVRVVDFASGYRGIFLDNAMQTAYNKREGRFDLGYIVKFEEAVELLPGAKTVLSIGLGAGAIDRILRRKGLDVDNVEIDEAVVTAAREYFGFDGNVIIGDGRHYARTTEKRYDMAFLDAFNGFSIPSHIITKEAFETIKISLNEGGILVVNVVGTGYTNRNGEDFTFDRLVSAVDATLREVFDNVIVRMTGHGVGNFVFCASDSAFPEDSRYKAVDYRSSPVVLTDDHNPAEFLKSITIEEWRDIEIRRSGDRFFM